MSRSSDVAKKIDAHLKRWDADPQINARRKTHGGTRPYYCAGAFAHGGWVRIAYVSYQGTTNLRAPDAERYLAWIERGNVGRHYEAFREMDGER